MSTRVAFDVGPTLGARSGIGVAVSELWAALLHHGDSVELVPYVLSRRSQLAGGITRLPYPAAVAHRVWSRADWPRADGPLRHPAVIHGTNYVVPPARAARLVSVYDCWFLRHPDGVHADVARAATVLRRSIRRGTTVVCSSQATADELRTIAEPERLEVIPLGYVAAPPPPDRAPEACGDLVGRPFVLALGTVERRKNLPTLVAAFGAAATAAPDLQLVIAGSSGNDSAAVQAVLDTLPSPVRAAVHLLGRVDDATKGWLLAHARLLAYPSLDEGFGFPLLEAMGAGRPVVASSVGSIPEVAGEAALLVAPDDVDGLAAALLRAHLDEPCRAALVAAGHLNVSRYSWATTAARLAALYHALAMEPIR